MAIICNSPSEIRRTLPSKWMQQSGALMSRMPEWLRPWLVHPASMTLRMDEASSACFRLDLLKHAWEVPDRVEAARIELKKGERAIVREVLLSMDGHLCMYARSILPESIVKETGYKLLHLGATPIGERIFREKKPSRSAFEYSRLRPGHFYYHLAQRHTPQKITQWLWARRSVFKVFHGRLLVTEVFLPDLYYAC